MSTPECFDVLNIIDKNENVDMIQSLLGADCLGTYFINGDAKLYFNDGKKNDIEILLQEICADFPFHWIWEKQKKEDWHLAWKDNFEPVVIDKKLAVIPNWQDDYQTDIVIKIKPGMAFGTGHHETTWLMLSQMMKHIKLGMSVLDLGTGSGILSMAAIKLGAGKVDAVENDKECGTNFCENLHLNNIKDQIQFHHEDVLNWSHFSFDLILVNINRNVIEELLPKLNSTNGKVILSGLLKMDFNSIKNICNNFGLKVADTSAKGEWISLILSCR